MLLILLDSNEFQKVAGACVIRQVVDGDFIMSGDALNLYIRIQTKILKYGNREPSRSMFGMAA